MAVNRIAQGAVGKAGGTVSEQPMTEWSKVADQAMAAFAEWWEGEGRAGALNAGTIADTRVLCWTAWANGAYVQSMRVIQDVRRALDAALDAALGDGGNGGPS